MKYNCCYASRDGAICDGGDSAICDGGDSAICDGGGNVITLLGSGNINMCTDLDTTTARFPVGVMAMPPGLSVRLIVLTWDPSL